MNTNNISNICDYFSAAMDRPREDWTTENTIALSSELSDLRDFGGSGQPVLIINPMAGHGGDICDFAPGQSLVETISSTGHHVYALAWRSCPIWRRSSDVEDLVNEVLRATEKITEAHPSTTPVLVGLCMGGWLASICASLHPEAYDSLIVAGSPINAGIDREKSVVCKWADEYPMSFFENMVLWGGGLMRGDFMLTGWMSNDPVEHFIGRHVKLYNSEGADREKIIRFYRWYNHTKNLPGKAYLWIIKNVFRENNLWNGSVELFGEQINIQNIDIPVISISGGKDDITPAGQAHANSHVRLSIPGAGHIGVFMGGEKTQSVWRALFGRGRCL